MQGRPQFLTDTGPAPVDESEQNADDRQHGVGRVAHPEAQIERIVPVTNGPGFVLETRGGLVERVQTAETAQGILQSVGVGVAVDDVVA